MKKLIYCLLGITVLAACNNAGNNTENIQDSLDSVANTQTQRIDSVAEQRIDSVDSAVERKKDALERSDTANRRDTTRR
jgi:hypothetical protein